MAAIGEEDTTHTQNTDNNKRKLDNIQLDGIQLAKQKAQEIAARLLSNAPSESKKSRFDSFETPSYPDFTPKTGSQMGTGSQLAYNTQSGSQYGFQGQSKRIEIPNAKVGVIIGKGGETIKYLQLQSGARIHITKDTDADPSSQTRDVEINGKPDQISRAEKLINDVIEETDAGGAGSTAARGSNFIAPGADQFSMKIPNDKVAWVIGKGGETIKNIQSRTGARIQIIPLHPPPGDTSTERSVFISGTQEQIDSAKELVTDVVNGNRLRNVSSTGSYPPQQGYGAAPGNWAQPPMQQQQYAQPGAYASGPPPYYSNYPPPQQGVTWDPNQPNPPPQQYNYYGQQTQTEANPNASYAYTQTAPTTNTSYDQSYSQSYGQQEAAPTQDNSQYTAVPGYGQPPPPAGSTQVDGTVPPAAQPPYGTQPPPVYPATYSQPQTGYYSAPQQGYDQSGYAQPGYGAYPTSQPAYGQGGYPSQPPPSQPGYAQGPPVYGQQPQSTYTDPSNGDGNSNNAHAQSYGNSPAVPQESAQPPLQS
ncbi:hypothetical protein ACHQM5_015523 [Ranunculus cassubicifolius]